MAEWKKVLISGSNIDVAQISSSDIPTVTGGENLLALTADGGFKQIAQSNVTSPDTMGSGFTVSADTNTATTTITESDTLTLTGGTNIATVSNPDGTITIAVDGTVANATDAVNATEAVVSNDTDNAEHPLTFIDDPSPDGDSEALKANATITANPGLNSGTITAANFKGIATSASKALVTKDLTTNTDFPLIFGENVGSAASIYAGLFQDTGITINPSTETITATTFAGNATTATTTTTANNVKTATDNGNVDHYFTYVDNATAEASTALKVDAGVKYNPSTNVLTVEGGLVVNGTTTTIDTTNLTVEDRFILLSSGSKNNGDGGIVIEKDSGGTGTALFWDQDTKSWAIDFGGVDASNADPAAVDGRLVVVEAVAADPDQTSVADYPLNGSNSSGWGQMWVNTSPVAGESGIWIFS